MIHKYLYPLLFVCYIFLHNFQDRLDFRRSQPLPFEGIPLIQAHNLFNKIRPPHLYKPTIFINNRRSAFKKMLFQALTNERGRCITAPSSVLKNAGLTDLLPRPQHSKCVSCIINHSSRKEVVRRP